MIQTDVFLNMFKDLYVSMTELYNKLNLPISDILDPDNTSDLVAQFIGFVLDVIGLLSEDVRLFIENTTLISFILGGSISIFVAVTFVKWVIGIVT